MVLCKNPNNSKITLPLLPLADIENKLRYFRISWRSYDTKLTQKVKKSSISFLSVGFDF